MPGHDQAIKLQYPRLEHLQLGAKRRNTHACDIGQPFVIVITGGLGSMAGALLGGLLIGATEALAGLLFTPSAKSMFAFAILVLVLLFRPQGILGKRSI